MKYTKSQRMKIGKEIFYGEYTVSDAAEKYDLNFYTARNYLREYKASLCLRTRKKSNEPDRSKLTVADFEKMSKEELIREILRLQV